MHALHHRRTVNHLSLDDYSLLTPIQNKSQKEALYTSSWSSKISPHLYLHFCVYPILHLLWWHFIKNDGASEHVQLQSEAGEKRHSFAPRPPNNSLFSFGSTRACRRQHQRDFTCRCRLLFCTHGLEGYDKWDVHFIRGWYPYADANIMLPRFVLALSVNLDQIGQSVIVLDMTNRGTQALSLHNYDMWHKSKWDLRACQWMVCWPIFYSKKFVFNLIPVTSTTCAKNSCLHNL